MKKPVYNDVIDFQRALLIVMVILVHIVNFGTLYPEVKERIFLPIISELNTDGALPLAAGRDIKNIFFPALYDAEGNGFVFRSGSAKTRERRKRLR